MKNEPTIWHNPRCSKSRQTLSLLQDKGFSPQIRKYLEEPPTAEELNAALTQLGLSPRELMRKKEALYKEKGLSDTSLSASDLVAAMSENPRLIERPIVFFGGRAAIGRPPENTLSILNVGSGS